MQIVKFHVPGKPQGKARARTVHNKNINRSVSYTPDNTMLYENLIKTLYIQSAKGVLFGKEIPIKLSITASFIPVKSASKKKQQQMLTGEILPLKKPDIDNIVKVVADSLNGVAYQDDTHIACVEAKKVYDKTEGLHITVESY